jgi:hypothetical protein
MTVVHFQAGNFRLASALSPILEPSQYLVQWTSEDHFSDVKWSGNETCHSAALAVEVRNAWSYSSAPLYARYAWRNIKLKGSLCFHRVRMADTNQKTSELCKSRVSIYCQSLPLPKALQTFPHLEVQKVVTVVCSPHRGQSFATAAGPICPNFPEKEGNHAH